MIEVIDVHKSFGDKEVLKGIDAQFLPGECSLIIGASGSGKSTLARCIVGLIEPTKGKVIFDGRDFTAMKNKDRKDIRKEIGFLFQGSALFDYMTVEQNVRFPLDILTNMTTAEKDERVAYCLERVELDGAEKLFPAEVSGGMKKRVGIARAISPEPKYLFCDEPNSGLDPQTSIIIDKLISDITKEHNMTTVVITHDMNSVIEIGDSILFIHKGDKWWEGNNKEILNTDNPEVVDFVYASEFMKAIRKQ